MTDCLRCGRELPDQIGPGRKRSYCSTACRDAAYRDRDRLWRDLGHAVGALVEARSLNIWEN